MRNIIRDFKEIKRRNGYEAVLVLFSLYLERIAFVKTPFKILKLFITRHYLCDISPYSFNSIEAIVTCKMPHPFMIIINSSTSIGNNSIIYHNVTIGNREGRHDASNGAFLGDNVFIGNTVSILGDVRIGNNVRIGSLSVILKDIDNDQTITGIYK